MLEDTDLSAEDVNISVDDIDGDLSENEIDRLVNMDLDNIIEDAKDESVSLDDIFEDAKDVEDNNDDLLEKMREQVKTNYENLFTRLQGFSFFITEEQLQTLPLKFRSGSAERLIEIMCKLRSPLYPMFP
jgi:hypothetical protein